jgi:peptidoglycan/LPS O-acetylase OafA/YrhL
MDDPRTPVRNLDVLRATAVLLVAFDHLLDNGFGWLGHSDEMLLATGRLGVLIFFVHTSLVLMLSMERMHLAGRHLVGSFYIRRFFRIYPLSVVTVIAVAGLSIPFLPFQAFQPLSAFQLFSNLALIQNITRAKDAIGPLWSLPWEVQMYLVLPFVFFGLRSGRTRLVAIVALAVVAIDAVGVGTGHRPFRMLDYVPCFMGGVLAYALLGKSKTKLTAYWWPVALLLIAIAYIASGLGYPVQKIYYPDWITCIILGFLIPKFRDLRANILTSAAHQVAKYSYGIYLFHLPAIWLAFDRWHAIGPVASTAVFLVATATLSVAGYYIVEEPMIRTGKRLAARIELGGLSVAPAASTETTV